MCGIFGIITSENANPSLDFLKKTTDSLFKFSESRGKEAAGLALRTGRSINVYKVPISATAMISSQSYKRLFSDILKNEFKGNDDGRIKSPIAIIGHSRLVTNGLQELNQNNQPVIKDGIIGIHNGIITNMKELWNQFPSLEKKYDVDTEIFLSLLSMYYHQKNNLIPAVQDVFQNLKGSASVALLFDTEDYVLLATNTGSLYTCNSLEEDMLIFASESYFLKELISHSVKNKFDKAKILQVPPGTGLLVNVFDLKITPLSLFQNSGDKVPEITFLPRSFQIKDFSPPDRQLPNILTSGAYKLKEETKKSMRGTWEDLYYKFEIKRCTKCILPITMPFIDFDEDGICNYCRNHKPHTPKGIEELEKKVFEFRSKTGEPDCLVPFSGGRDSSYGLHFVKNILKMNPIAYTYDWGVLTDLGRRNQARICGQLGIEHIIVSANIPQKREYVRKNLNAWLKNPELGMIPLLMAGDKPLLYHGKELQKKIGTPVMIHSCGNQLEEGLFKIGFGGIQMDSNIPQQLIPRLDKLKLPIYYAKQYIKNPSYLNSSILDTIFAFFSNFFLPDNSLHLYEYIEWDEENIISTLVKEYDWELEKDTKTTWRIDDGTTPFYNYIYMTVAGFTEHDTFRSNQIRQGMITREKALALIQEENKPRFDSIEWYSQITGVDLNRAISIINSIPKLY